MSRKIEELIIKRIKEGKPLNRKKGNTKIEIEGGFYSVWFYQTRIALGRVGEMPFAFKLDGWTTNSTLSRLNALGFNIYSKRIVCGEFINPRTNRKNKIRQSVLHIENTPMIKDDPNFPPGSAPRYIGGVKFLWNKVCDYYSWYSKNGHKLTI